MRAMVRLVANRFGVDQWVTTSKRQHTPRAGWPKAAMPPASSSRSRRNAVACCSARAPPWPHRRCSRRSAGLPGRSRSSSPSRRDRPRTSTRAFSPSGSRARGARAPWWRTAPARAASSAWRRSRAARRTDTRWASAAAARWRSTLQCSHGCRTTRARTSARSRWHSSRRWWFSRTTSCRPAMWSSWSG